MYRITAGKSREEPLSTLQKVIRNGDLYSTVSSEAIRYAIRELWALQTEKVCRDVTKPPKEAWDKDGKTFKKPEDFIDNDVLGYMHAKEDTVTRRGILKINKCAMTQHLGLRSFASSIARWK